MFAPPLFLVVPRARYAMASVYQLRIGARGVQWSKGRHKAIHEVEDVRVPILRWCVQYVLPRLLRCCLHMGAMMAGFRQMFCSPRVISRAYVSSKTK
ncbi:hypothetical protein BD309DRAFT_562669 [Dichomitus squalens]|nr:hypothetical protein BD309DRAFT_562669 [Dichomitus squalens]